MSNGENTAIFSNSRTIPEWKKYDKKNKTIRIKLPSPTIYLAKQEKSS